MKSSFKDIKQVYLLQYSNYITEYSEIDRVPYLSF